MTDYEYRACRKENGCLGKCREPELSEKIYRLNVCLVLTTGIAIATAICTYWIVANGF